MILIFLYIYPFINAIINIIFLFYVSNDESDKNIGVSHLYGPK